MTNPAPLSAFKDQFLESREIQKLIAENFGDQAGAAIERFKSGDAEELWDLIEDNKQEISNFPEETIEAAGPEYDVFEIEIWSTGPVAWIRANEYDDIGYFPSLTEARAYAEMEFEGPISELLERENED